MDFNMFGEVVSTVIALATLWKGTMFSLDVSMGKLVRFKFTSKPENFASSAFLGGKFVRV